MALRVLQSFQGLREGSTPQQPVYHRWEGELEPGTGGDVFGENGVPFPANDKVFIVDEYRDQATGRTELRVFDERHPVPREYADQARAATRVEGYMAMGLVVGDIGPQVTGTYDEELAELEDQTGMTDAKLKLLYERNNVRSKKFKVALLKEFLKEGSLEQLVTADQQPNHGLTPATADKVADAILGDPDETEF